MLSRRASASARSKAGPPTSAISVCDIFSPSSSGADPFARARSPASSLTREIGRPLFDESGTGLAMIVHFHRIDLVGQRRLERGLRHLLERDVERRFRVVHRMWWQRDKLARHNLDMCVEFGLWQAAIDEADPFGLFGSY